VVHEKIFEDLSKLFLILPLIGAQKGAAPLFEQIWIPIPQEYFLLRWNWPSGSWKKVV